LLVDEARAVIARLDRIEAMERAREPAELVLEQLALLAGETELWLRSEQSAGADAHLALERCLEALERSPAGTPARSIR
jgi:hypothetical protein